MSTTRKAVLKKADVVDRLTGEVLDDEGCKKVLQTILEKDNEIIEGQNAVRSCQGDCDSVNAARDAAQEKVRGLRKELKDLIAGQRLLFD